MADGKTPLTGPALVLLSGLPGAGKTTFAHAFVAATGARHIESDAIRRAMVPEPRYEPEEHAAVFARAEALVSEALRAGEVVVFDATNLTVRDRRRFVRAARHADATLVAVRLTAPEPVLRERLAAPREGWSQAGPAVLDLMRTRPRPFTVPVVVVDTRFPLDPAISAVVALLREDQEEA